MKRNLFVILAALTVLSWPTQSIFAQHHAHEENHEQHDEAEGHAHDDGHEENNNHGEDKDDHDGHGHDGHEGEDAHDDHGHGGHGDEHDEHEEGKTEILLDDAKNSGIVLDKVAPATISNIIPLTGRIVLNQNAKADVRARFPGIVRSVNVSLGESVEKGQILAVVEANESLKNYDIIAPISGTILERNTNLGDVANNDALFTISDLTEVWAKFHVFPKDAETVQSGQDVRVYTLDESKASMSKIDMLFPTADALSQTLVAIVPLSNEQGLWRPGMTVEGDVAVSEKQVNLAVRTSALQTMENQTVVFVKEGNVYEQMPVQTGMGDADYVEIRHGLKAGQDYVSEGSFIIKADIMKAGAQHQH